MTKFSVGMLMSPMKMKRRWKHSGGLCCCSCASSVISVHPHDVKHIQPTSLHPPKAHLAVSQIRKHASLYIPQKIFSQPYRVKCQSPHYTVQIFDVSNVRWLFTLIVMKTCLIQRAAFTKGFQKSKKTQHNNKKMSKVRMWYEMDLRSISEKKTSALKCIKQSLSFVFVSAGRVNVPFHLPKRLNSICCSDCTCFLPQQLFFSVFLPNASYDKPASSQKRGGKKKRQVFWDKCRSNLVY